MVRTDLEEAEGVERELAAEATGGEPRERAERSSPPLGELGRPLDREERRRVDVAGEVVAGSCDKVQSQLKLDRRASLSVGSGALHSRKRPIASDAGKLLHYDRSPRI